MKTKPPALTIGLEEELFLVDEDTGDLCSEWPQELLAYCQEFYLDNIVREFISSQIELITPPYQTVSELSQSLTDLRALMIDKARKYGITLMASSTHPTGNWRSQTSSQLPRYRDIAEKLQISANRMLIGGMHLHVGLDDEAQRMQVMNRMIYYLPVILSLSCSSPFWCGEDTGLSSYRASVLKGLPRSGFPHLFENYADYLAYIEQMKAAKSIENGREIWWDVRLSSRFPTVEIRIADTCTNIAVSMAIAALIQSLARHIVYRPSKVDLHEEYRIATENRWRAQRYPIQESELITPQILAGKPCGEVIDELVTMLESDAETLGCLPQLRYCREIVKQGTSADMQREVYLNALARGESNADALNKVKHFLIAETQLI